MANETFEEFMSKGWSWRDGGGKSVELDTTLTESGKAADAKATGDAIRDIDVVDPEKIKEAVDDFLVENPVQPYDDSEVVDIRLGADGTNYATAGEAVRGQVSRLSESISDIDNEIHGYSSQDMSAVSWVDGMYISSSNGKQYNSAACASTGFIKIPDGTTDVLIRAKNTAHGSAGFGLYRTSVETTAISAGRLNTHDEVRVEVDSDARYIRITSDLNEKESAEITWSSNIVSYATKGLAALNERLTLSTQSETAATNIEVGKNVSCAIRHQFIKGCLYKIKILATTNIASFTSLNVYLNDYDYYKGKLNRIYQTNVIFDEIEVDVTADGDYPFLLMRLVNAGIGTVEYTVTITENGSATDTAHRFTRFPRQNVLPLLSAATTDRTDGRSLYTPVTLVHYSDIHLDVERANHVADFCESYKDYVDDAIMTGDVCGTSFPDYNDMYAGTKLNNHLLAIGNHDVYDVDGNAASNGESYDSEAFWASNTDKYNQYIAPSVSQWGVTQPQNAAANGYCYYYKDYVKTSEQTKVRLIVLDAMSYDSAQHSWFNSALKGAKNAGYSVVVAEHFIPTESSTDYTLFDTGFSSVIHGMESPYGTLFLSCDSGKATNLVDDFIDDGGDFVCWLAGHMHYAQVGTLMSHPRQIFIAVEKAKIDHIWADTPRVLDCENEDLFNVVSVDTHSKLIRVVRIGAKLDNRMRHKEAMCIDYANRQLISTF